MPFSMSDLLAAYGGSPDPENPSSGEITPGLVLQALQAIDRGGGAAYGKMATDIATLPRRAIEGAGAYQPGVRREDVTDIPASGFGTEPADVAVGPATEAAMTLAGVGTGFAQPGSAGIFGGRLAKNAPLEKYDQANKMLLKGASRQEIYDATGLTLGAEGKLKHEIPDYGTGFTDLGRTAIDTGTPTTLGRAYNHPGLFEAYPELRNVNLKFEDPIPGSNSFGGIDKQTNTLYINPAAFDPDYLAGFNLTEKQRLKGVVPGEEGMRSTFLHEAQHMVQGPEGFAAGGNIWMPQVQRAADRSIREQTAAADAQYQNLLQQTGAYVREQQAAGREGTPQQFIKEYYDQNPATLNEIARLKYQIGTARNPQSLAKAKQQAYESLAGETEARNVQYRRDLPPEELAKKPAWETQDVPYGQQLLRFTDLSGNQIRGRTKPVAQQELPSFSERMGTARDVAFAGRQRGTGNILPRSTANEAPLLAPGETRGDLQGALTPGIPPAETSIADLGRNRYRGSVATETGPFNRELSRERLTPADVLEGAAGPISGVGRPFIRPEVTPTVPRPVRIAAPGIYGDPRDIAAQALGQIAPEHPALKELFGVNRRDLADIAASRTGNVDPYTLLPGWKAGSRGSEVGQAVANPQNAQRLVDILAEAQKIPEVRDAIGWYVMDPAFQRLERLVGTEEAIRIYRPANAITAMASPGSEVPVELRRGTAASMMAARGEFPTFEKYGGMAAKDRPRNFPEALRDVPGHVYHATSQTGPMADYLRTGQVQMESPKVPLYIGASGVPQTGFQTGLPIADVHFSGGVGSWDLRQAKKWRESMRMPEFQTVGPWYAQNVAKPAGLEPVSAQALQWTTLGPHTGVESLLGAPKLELLAQSVWQRAKQMGVDPQRLLDMVLQRQAHAALPIAGAAGAAAASMRQGE